MKPSCARDEAALVDGGCAIDPATGRPFISGPGLYWEQTPRGTYEVQNVVQHNVVAQQVQTDVHGAAIESRGGAGVRRCATSPKQKCERLPVTDLPSRAGRQWSKRCPYTVMKPVEERIEQKVPVTVCHIVISETASPQGSGDDPPNGL